MAEGVSAGAQDFGVAAKTRSSEIAPRHRRPRNEGDSLRRAERHHFALLSR